MSSCEKKRVNERPRRRLFAGPIYRQLYRLRDEPRESAPAVDASAARFRQFVAEIAALSERPGAAREP